MKLSIENVSESSEEEDKSARERPKINKLSSDKGPKIVVTPAEGKEKEHAKLTVGSLVSIPSYRPDRKKVFFEKLAKLFRVGSARKETINLVGEQIRKRQMLEKQPAGTIKMNSGRLLNIIAEQAVFGKNYEISKTFKAALV